MYSEFIDKDRLADFELLLNLIRADLTPERIKRAGELVEAGGIDWGRILHLSEKHRVLPILYANIKKAGLLPVLPEDVHRDLFRWYWKIVGNNLRMCKKLVAVLGLLENHDIPAVPFKGPVLAQQLYGDVGLRFFQDLDILVPKNYADQAREVMLASGYLPAAQQLTGKRFPHVLKYARECSFLDVSNNVKVSIDLHWQLSLVFRRAFDYGFCKERLKTIRFQDQDVFCLSAEDSLLHLCLNGAHDIWDHLEKILCIAEWINKHPELDWQLTLELAGLLHCRRRLLLGLFLARDVFGVLLPGEIVDQIKKDKIIEKIAETIYTDLFDNTHQANGIHGRVSQLPYYLKIREHPGDKFSYLMRRIFIPTQKDWEKRSPDSRFSGFYFLTRPIGLAVELVKALRQ